MSRKTDQVLCQLAPEWPDDLLDQINMLLASDNRKIVVLDDDPTGTQTVHQVPILTTWGVEELAQELENPGPVFYVLTNSRSLPQQEAVELAAELAENLSQASRKSKREFVLVSRSDSTLRGHYPAEVDALTQTLGMRPDAHLIIPCFMEGGRLTIDDVHYVETRDELVPAGETPYADDASFGYAASNLKEWVAEKTRNRVQAQNVVSISLDDLRHRGPDRITEILAALTDESVCIVNGVTYRDLQVLVAGLLQAETLGKRFIYRTAASFVRVRAGLGPRELLNRQELLGSNPSETGGLFIVGSHVPRSTEQLNALLDTGTVVAEQMNVNDLLSQGRREQAITDAANRIEEALASGKDAVLYTSRELVKADSVQQNLEIGKTVSSGLIAVLQKMQVRPRYLVAKGGITSSDVATQAVGIRRAMVVGQILPGVPVWHPDSQSRYPDMPYIVFPGNVGDVQALARIQSMLRG